MWWLFLPVCMYRRFRFCAGTIAGHSTQVLRHDDCAASGTPRVAFVVQGFPGGTDDPRHWVRVVCPLFFDSRSIILKLTTVAKIIAFRAFCCTIRIIQSAKCPADFLSYAPPCSDLRIYYPVRLISHSLSFAEAIQPSGALPSSQRSCTSACPRLTMRCRTFFTG